MYKLLFLLFLLLSVKVYGQSPIASFNIPSNGCNEEMILSSNLSSNSTSYEWDLCIGNFSVNPLISENILINSIPALYGLKIINDGSNFYGFATGLSTNELFRLDFGSSIENVPVVNNLGQLAGILKSPEGIDILKIDNKWVGFIGFGANGGHFTRLTWSSLEEIPIAENIGNFGFAGRIRDLQMVKQNGNYILVFPYYNEPKIARINFNNSPLNTPSEPTDVYTSNSITNVSLPRGISVLKKNNEWKIILVSETNGAINYLNLGNDILSEPVVVNTFFFSEIVRPLRIKIAREGSQYFALVSNDRSNIGTALVNMKSLDVGDSPEVLDLYNSQYLGLDVIKIKSSSFFFSASTNLSKLNFSNECTTIPSYSDQFEPNFRNTTSGITEVDLLAYNDQNENDFITKSITTSTSFAPQPSPQITGNCLSSPVSFDGQQISGDITTWNWDYGDGIGTSNLQSDTYTYASTGAYQVKLSVTDANGCNNFIIDTVHVYNEPVPNFAFSGGTSLCKNNLVTFTNTSTGETGDIVTWNWDFNGEGASSEKEPTFTFLTPGTKNITLTSSIPGCANVIQQTLTIIDAPTTNFNFSNTCNGQSNTFTDETAGDNLTSWDWNFGDGNTSIEQSPTHAYSSPGEYKVTLTVTNNTGCFTSSVQTVVNHSIPIVSFTNDLPCTSAPIRFFDQSLVDNTNIVAWEWEFGDGAKSNIQNPTHLYTQTGDFNVQLKAYSQFGCVDSIQSLINVAQGPEVEFEWDKSCEGDQTTFTDLTNSLGTNITDWTWIIDGQLFTTQNPSFTFSNAGTYPIQLSVTVDNLCAQTLTHDIIIEVPPLVQFDFDEGCNGADTEFYDLTDQENDPIIAREWRVDGSPTLGDSIAPVQLGPGYYDITLTVTTAAGCVETTTRGITLIGSPKANFSTNTIYGAVPLAIQFTNESTGGSIYNWSFGDLTDSTSTDKNPSFTYTDIGVYSVTLKTSSEADCFEESSQIIEVVEPETKATLVAITPIENPDKTNFRLTIENSGTTLLNSNLSILFRVDYGTEVIESFEGLIYAGKTINYNASFALPANSNPANVCVELIEINQLDKECILLQEQVLISEPYPNPSSGVISVDVMLEIESSIELRIINRSGQPVIRKSFEGVIGLNELILDGQRLPQGIYIVEIIAGGKTEKLKTSIVR